ncbi:class I SAM-dependent methyltransferase [Carboxydochorda subterranea]|uniref:Class I SAM-dependent methyltransferase n=1 Tax=Carboxydichorda subterranea TaxID=3109565 RepID=A0ABZ1BZB3_9FIRM|nr:class I SAM-dependent methyltransferase [Limnochorda sp. L945t]WRP18175.1 class I SAM-dependent methyltransferase [Limnochorda sp. L945t]
MEPIRPATWGSVEATVGEVLRALMERAREQGGAAGTTASRAATTPGAGPPRRRRRRSLPAAARYAAWRARWEQAVTLRKPLGRGRPILDVGCYEGALVTRLAEVTGRPVIGVDISDAGFGRAFQQAEKAGVEAFVGCMRYDAHHLSALGSQLFDAATLTYSLHCMRAPDRVLAEVARVLTWGGVVLVVDWVVATGEPKHGCSRLTLAEIEEMMRSAGLTPIRSVARDGVALVAGEKREGSIPAARLGVLNGRRAVLAAREAPAPASAP